MKARDILDRLAAAADPLGAAVSVGELLPLALRVLDAAGRVLFQNGLATDLLQGEPSARAQAQVVAAALEGASSLPLIEWRERALHRRLAIEHGALGFVDAASGTRLALAWACDVTHVELARKQSRGCELMFDNAPDGMLVVDARGVIRRVNARLCGLFGYRAEELLGAKVEMLVPLERAPDHARRRDAYLQGPTTRPMASGLRLSGRRKDGTEVAVDIALSPFLADDGPSVIAAVRDVGEARRLEAQLQQSQRLDALGQLAGGIAHDFNNLLSVVLSYASLALSDLPVDDPLGPDLLAIRSAAERGADLTSKILAFARTTPVEPRVVSVNHQITEIEPLLRRTLGEALTLTVVLDPRDPKVEIDPAQLGQVLVNLVVNARDAMPRGGTITLSTDAGEHVDATAQLEPAPGPFMRIRVDDTGDGIEGNLLHRVFEPFFSTKAPGRGTGLGLSTVLGIVKQAGGRIDVESVRGRGTSFVIQLPRTERQTTPRTRPPDTPPRRKGRATVLLVEDDANVRAATQAILARGEFEVLVAGSPEAALAAVAAHPGRLDLLLADVVMPGMSGVELAEQILAQRPHTRVLFMTGYTDHPAIVSPSLGRELSVVSKPLTLQSLMAAIHGVLDAEAVASVS